MTRRAAAEPRRRRRWINAALVIGFVLAATVAPFGAAHASADVTMNKTITRTYLSGTPGNVTTTVVDQRSFSATVSDTTDLRNRQDVDVSWTGAHPTGGIQRNYNGTSADQQEYPVVVLERRGTDQGTGSAAATPQTCRTHGAEQRYVADFNDPFGAWRLDADAAPADRAAVVGRPSTLPSACPSQTNPNEYWLPFIGVDGTSYPYGPFGCAGIPAEDYLTDSSSTLVPQNTTFAASNLSGDGSIKFDISTDEQDASLGCSATVACTLEVIPIEGISCDPEGLAGNVPAADIPSSTPVAPSTVSELTTATANCEQTGVYTPGELSNVSLPPASAVSGQLWWSASNWNNRVSFPLTFAPESNACDLDTAGTPAFVYGSELLEQATEQWAPDFCLDPSLFKFVHVVTGEPLADNLLNTGGVQAAFSTFAPPGGFALPVDQAPVAVSGFAVSFNIDDANGVPVTSLRLDPRLLAKLLTESYQEQQCNADTPSPGQPYEFSYLGDNPTDITQDPEFQALNPGIALKARSLAETQLCAGAAALIVLDSNSDVTTALTSYINSDPEARAWLDGAPDPWGMTVNPAYKGIALPVNQWPLLDSTIANPGGVGQDASDPCEFYNPIPWLPAVASPTATLALTTLAVQFAIPTAKTACVNSSPTGLASAWELTPAGRQQPGGRFTIGVTSLGEAARYDLNTAQLQTFSTITDFSAPFTDASNRFFVGPTEASLEVAAKDFTYDSANGDWTLPYATLGQSPGAYPGTMMINADIPTTGLTSTFATDYANLLRFAAGPGQETGLGNGQLPPGYLPLTSADGLATQVDYTLRAATDVQKQTGVVTPLVPVATSTSTPPSTTSDEGGSLPEVTDTGGVTAVSTRSSAAASPSPHASLSPSSTPSRSLSLAANPGRTKGIATGGLVWVLPIMLGIGVLAALGSASSFFAPRPRRR